MRIYAILYYTLDEKALYCRCKRGKDLNIKILHDVTKCWNSFQLG